MGFKIARNCIAIDETSTVGTFTVAHKTFPSENTHVNDCFIIQLDFKLKALKAKKISRTIGPKIFLLTFFENFLPTFKTFWWSFTFIGLKFDLSVVLPSLSWMQSEKREFEMNLLNYRW